jgi:hypothetical protein
VTFGGSGFIRWVTFDGSGFITVQFVKTFNIFILDVYSVSRKGRRICHSCPPRL